MVLSVKKKNEEDKEDEDEDEGEDEDEEEDDDEEEEEDEEKRRSSCRINTLPYIESLGNLFSLIVLCWVRALCLRHASDRFLCASARWQAPSLQLGPRHANIGFQGAA